MAGTSYSNLDEIRNTTRVPTYVEASAGTGKTTALVARVKALISKGEAEIEEIVAITFTRAAASELRYRLINELEDPNADDTARKRLEKAQNNVFKAHIQTIDAFAMAIITDYSMDADLPPLNSSTAEDVNSNFYRKQQWDEWIANQLQNIDSPIANVIYQAELLGLTNPLSKLGSMALETHRVNPNPQCLQAMLDRLKNSHYDTDELQSLLDKVQPTIDAIVHRSPLSLEEDRLFLTLKNVWLPSINRARENPTELDQFINTIANGKLGKGGGKAANWNEFAETYPDLMSQLEQILREIEPDDAPVKPKEVVFAVLHKVKQEFERLLQTRKDHTIAELVEVAIQFVQHYDNRHRELGTPSFQDTINWTLKLLKQNAAVRNKIQQRYPYILIDEFQDTDPAQIELIRQLSDLNSNSTQRKGALFLTGDPKQSIYGFRGADIKSGAVLIDEVINSSAGRKLSLDTGYRSPAQLVEWNNELFSNWFKELNSHFTPIPGLESVGIKSGVKTDIDPRIALAGHSFADAKFFKLNNAQWRELKDQLSENSQLNLLARTRDKLIVTVNEDPQNGEPTVTIEEIERLLNASNRAGYLCVESGEINIGEKYARRAGLVRAIRATAVTQLARFIGDGQLNVRDPITKTVRPAHFGDLCLLVVKHSDVTELEGEFTDNGIPFTREGQFPIFDSPPIINLISVLRAIENPTNQLNLIAALKSFLLGCSDADLYDWKQGGGTFDYTEIVNLNNEAGESRVAQALNYISELHAQSKLLPAHRIVRQVIDDRKLEHIILASTEFREPELEIRKVRLLLEQAQETIDAPLRHFIGWCDNMIANDAKIVDASDRPFGDAVRIMTVHAAKGREFPVVVALTGTSSAFAPAVITTGQDQQIEYAFNFSKDFRDSHFERLYQAMGIADIQENVRLMYVAMTRARDHLFVCLHHHEKSTPPENSPEELVKHYHPAYFIDRFAPASTERGFPRSPAKTQPPPRTAEQLPTESDYNQWLTAMERFTELANIPQTTWASKFEAKLWQRSDNYDPETTIPNAAELGTLTHNVLAELELDASYDQIIELAKELNDDSDLEQHYELVARMVQATLSLPLVQRARAATDSFRESPLVLPLANGSVLSARIDLAFLTDDQQWVVVDYKTDNVKTAADLAQRAQGYQTQIDIYAAALTRVTGLPVAECYLVFCRAAAENRPAEFKMTPRAIDPTTLALKSE